MYKYVYFHRLQNGVFLSRRAGGGESLTTEDTESTEGVMKILTIRIFSKPSAFSAPPREFFGALTAAVWGYEHGLVGNL